SPPRVVSTTLTPASGRAERIRARMSSGVTSCSLSAAYIARRRGFSRRYTDLRMTLGTRVTLVTTTVIASVLAVSGYAALKVRRANLEADLGREAHEIAAALRAGLEPVGAHGGE